MKRRFSLVVLTASLFISGCTSCSNDVIEEDDNMNEKFEYSDLYKVENNKSEPITGKKLYKASYGYTQNSEQGYNNFYYKDLEGNSLPFNEDKFGSEAYIKNGEMNSTSTLVMYEFDVPETGKVKISGNPQLLSDSPVIVDIYLNDVILDSKTVKDSEGVYHEITIDVKKGDKIYFKMMNEGRIYWNPSIDYNYLNKEVSLHHTADGYYGDVHPFYDKKNNKMYMYYLSTGMEEDKVYERFSSLLYTSTNLIQYNREEVVMSKTNPPDQDLYFALGVYEDKDGNYRSCYGKDTYAGGSLSKDLITWELGSEPYIDENDDMLKYTFRTYFDNGCISGRDPYIYYDKESGQYYCIVMNYYSASRDQGEKYLTLYRANEDGIYNIPSTKLLSFTGRGDPECPQIMKIGDRWYIFYSVYGTGTSGNVGRFAYRVGDKDALPQDVNWESKEERFLDGGDLHAAQLVQVYDTYYLYGWINYEPYQNVWGGYLNLPHEVQVGEDGVLTQRYDPHITELLNRGEVVEVNETNVINSTFSSFTNGVFSGTGEAELDYDLSRNYLTFAVNSLEKDTFAGLSLGLNDLFIGVTNIDNETYLVVTRDINNNPLSDSYIKIDTSDKYSFKVSIDNQFIEVSVNDEAMLSTHTLLNSNYRLKVKSNGKNKIANLKVNKLADYNNIFD